MSLGINRGGSKARINGPGNNRIPINNNTPTVPPDPPVTPTWDITSPNQMDLIPVSANLTIPTYDADVRCTHPDVIYFADGWNGYKYWMLFTPYPAEARENPSMVVSNDGETWIVPPGGTNPIEAYPGGTDYNSDTDMVYRSDENKIYAFWRWTNNAVTRYYYKTSTDGITWSANTQIIERTGQFASLAMVYKDGLWKYWDVDVRIDGTHPVVYRESATLAGLAGASEVTIDKGTDPVGYHFWHMDIQWDARISKYTGLFCYTLSGQGSPNNGGKILFGISTDGLTWLIRDSFYKEPGSAYRGSYCASPYSTENGALYEMFYTIQWRIKRSLLFVSNTPAADYPYQSVVTNMASCFSMYYKLNGHYNKPTALVMRSTDNATIHVFPNAANDDLITADDVLLTTWAGAGTITVLRLYDQVYNGDYLEFTTGPVLTKGAWGAATKWKMTFNGSNTIGVTFTATNRVYAVTFAAKITSGAPWSIKSGSQYMGINTGTSFVLSVSGAITATDDATCNVWTGKPGASGILRKNAVQVATGANSAFANTGVQYAVGAQWAVTAYARIFDGELLAVVGWKDAATATDFLVVENDLKV